MVRPQDNALLERHGRGLVGRRRAGVEEEAGRLTAAPGELVSDARGGTGAVPPGHVAGVGGIQSVRRRNGRVRTTRGTRRLLSSREERISRSPFFLLLLSSGVDPDFYASVPYSLLDSRLLKLPHALWGMLPTSHLSNADAADDTFGHPFLRRLEGSCDAISGDTSVRLQPRMFVLDTDLRKHEEGKNLTSALYPHRMAGLNMVSGTSHVDEHGSSGCNYFRRRGSGVATPERARRVASRSSFVAPASPVLLLLLLDPYSPKQLRSCLHRLFLSLLTDSRFKSRFAAALGAVAYRPTSTLF